jgi:hypothetical protein
MKKNKEKKNLLSAEVVYVENIPKRQSLEKDEIGKDETRGKNRK